MAIAEHIGYDSTARPDANDLPGLLEHYRKGTGSLDDKVIRVRRNDITNSFRLDPVYHYLGPIIQQAFERIPHPIYTLHEVVSEPIPEWEVTVRRSNVQRRARTHHHGRHHRLRWDLGLSA